MINRIRNLLQLRRSTAFLLTRADDRLLADIGLSRDDLIDMHLGVARVMPKARAAAFPLLGKHVPA